MLVEIKRPSFFHSNYVGHSLSKEFAHFKNIQSICAIFSMGLVSNLRMSSDQFFDLFYVS